MSKSMAIMTWLNTNSNAPKIRVTDLREFKKMCTEEEWEEMAHVSAEELGVTLNS